jgi:hypothetical protein
MWQRLFAGCGSARGQRGKTALFNPYFDETKPALLAAGADGRATVWPYPVCYPPGARVIAALLGAGADIGRRARSNRHR